MSSMQETSTFELKQLYRDTQLEVLRLQSFLREAGHTSGVKESLRLLENYEANLKEELLRRNEDI